uniref:Phospholipid scramblase n=1 Tax=Rhodnius prolixus TaxID=13249 RepID=T1IB35_RHOPR
MRFGSSKQKNVPASSKNFHILNNQGQELWIAEDASSLTCCYGTFKVNIKDLSNTQIILLKSGFNCCLEKLEVYASDSLFIGTAQEINSIVFPKFSVLDQHGKKLFQIKQKGMCGANLFQITKLSNNEVIGNIQIIFNYVYEYEVKNAMSIRFPLNLEVDEKALLIGASFLVGLEKFLS